ncbi:hypothetical protein GCM10009864_74520 [Streptomyces lunalinharesii]|uniref:Uncharacterized protein n=1 Tax=Streptomyces lunalinharesii TaxID=333384 RepID=A0ABN3SYZ9_9ACTN
MGAAVGAGPSIARAERAEARYTHLHSRPRPREQLLLLGSPYHANWGCVATAPSRPTFQRAHHNGPVLLVGGSLGGTPLNAVANPVPEPISHPVVGA